MVHANEVSAVQRGGGHAASAGAGRDRVAGRGASLVQVGQPQADAPEAATGGRLGDGEREAGALRQAATLAVNVGLRLLRA